MTGKSGFYGPYGKDSYIMLDFLTSQQKRAPIDFELIAVHLDPKLPGLPEHVLPNYLTELGVPFKIIEEDIYPTVKRLAPVGKATRGLCSRWHRDILDGKKRGCH